MRLALVILALLVFSHTSAQADEFLIQPDGSGDYPTIQAAIDDLPDYYNHVIKLADGRFTGNGNRNINFGGKGFTIRSQSGRPESCVIDCQGSQFDNHRGFEFISGESYWGTRLEGVRIVNGYASGGSGIYCANSSPTITHCIIDSCGTPDGAGMMIEGDDSNPRISYCNFTNNVGNGFYWDMGDDHINNVENCLFVGNSGNGAVMDHDFSGGEFYQITFLNCHFLDNGEDGIAQHGWFIALTVSGGRSSGNAGWGVRGPGTMDAAVSVENCHVLANEAGGVIGDYFFSVHNCNISENLGHGIACYYPDFVTISDCIIRFNSGNGISEPTIKDSTPTTLSPSKVATAVIRNCDISYNGLNGISNAVAYHTLAITDCTILGNAQDGVHLDAGPTWGESYAKIHSCTISNNHLDGLSFHSTGICSLSNTIVSSNQQSGVDYAYADSIICACTDIFDNSLGDWVGDIYTQFGENGNFSLDPLFCAPEDSIFRLNPSSPCLPGNHPQGTDCGTIGARGVGCGSVLETPQNVEAVATGSGQVLVTWVDASAEEDSFRIDRSTSEAGPYQRDGAVAAGIREYLSEDLTPETSYWYQVVAFNGLGESLASAPDSATTWPGPHLGGELIPVSGNLNQACTITALLTNATAAYLIYREGGMESFISEEMVESTTVPGTWTATVPNSMMTTQGLQYYVSTTDGEDTIVLPEGAPSVLADIALTVTAPAAFVLPTRTFALLGTPVLLDAVAPQTVFDDLTPYDKRVMRYGTWDPTHAPSGRYLEFPAAAAIRPGIGFWIIAKNAQTVSATGSVISLSQNFSLTLHPGWNMIANPFPFDIPFPENLPGDVRHYLYGWNGTGYDNFSHEILRAGHGYWLDNAGTTVEWFIPPTGVPNGDKRAAEISPRQLADNETGWSIEVNATAGHLSECGNYFGVRPGATAGRDDYDFRSPPPPPSSYLCVYLIGSEGEQLISDYRDVQSRGEIWKLGLDSDLADAAFNITFSPQHPLPSDWQLVAIDLDNLIELDLLANRQLRGHISGSGSTRNWAIVAGPPDYIASSRETAEQEYNTSISHFRLAPVYPNPFLPEHGTVISLDAPHATTASVQVYDLRGRVVRTLHSGALTPGTHRFIWHGKDDTHQRVAAGVYFIRAMAPGATMLRKVIFMR